MDTDATFSTDIDSLGMLFGGLGDGSRNAQTILDALPCAVALVNTQGRFLHVNRRALELYGFDSTGLEMPGHVAGVRRLRLDGSPLPLEDMPVSRSIQSGQAVRNEEILIESAGGRRFPVSMISAPLRDRQGNITGAVIVFEDITVRRRAEEALRESEERQAYLLRLSDALREVENPQEIQRIACRLIKEQIGTETASYIECHFDDGYGVIRVEDAGKSGPCLKGIHKPDGHPASIAILKTGANLVIDDTLVTDVIPKDEAAKYLLHNIRAQISVPLIKNGRHVANFTTRQSTPRKWTRMEIELMVDTAERTWAAVERAKAEEALRRADERFNTMANAAPVLIWETDATGVVFLNQHYLDFFGEDFDAVRGMGWARFLHPEDAQGYVAAYREAFALRKPYSYECRFRRADGQYRWLLNTGRPFGDDCFVGCSSDITDSKRTEEALRESELQARALAAELDKKNRLVTDFFINISHEFKTPLTILMLGLELLEAKVKRMDCGENLAGNLAAMKQNSYRLNRLVANLLDITKLDAGFMQPKWEKTDVAGMLRNIAQSIEPYTRQKRLVSDFICDSTEIPFMTDVFMLERIILNLLSNGIKHTPAGGQISLTCRANGQGVSITVTDTGEGIPDEKKAIIFDRFSQVDTRMTRASEGTGIGLALTKSLVDLLGGKISVDSTPGAGSTFTVELPVVWEASVNSGAEQGNMQINKRVQMELSDINIP